MSSLQTYEHPYDDSVVPVWFVGEPAVAWRPGCWIKHRWMSHHGLGLLIADADGMVTVLWSQVPTWDRHGT